MVDMIRANFVALGVAIAILVVVAAWWHYRAAEGFEDGEDSASARPARLNASEQELFEDLTQNRLSEKEIQKLVSAGILTENLVEKFLAKLENADASTSKEVEVEGFAASEQMFSPASGF